MEEKHGKESLHILQEWENLEIKDSDYRNHQRFTFRCISKDLIPVNVRLKSTINSRRAKQIIHRAERLLLQDGVRVINGILWDNAIKLDRCRLRLLSLVRTTTTIEKCTNFINKVRELKVIKIWDRQVNKFNRLMGNKDKELMAQPLANNNQLQSQSNPNKWVINLSSTPLSLAQESPLTKGPNYGVAPKPPI